MLPVMDGTTLNDQRKNPSQPHFYFNQARFKAVCIPVINKCMIICKIFYMPIFCLMLGSLAQFGSQ